MTTTEARSTLPAAMISVEEARARILEHFAPLDVVETPLLEAAGQVLAADVRGGFDIPPLPNTSMDGYAVRAADTAGATPGGPLRLRVTGYLPAGSVYDGAVGPGEAVRIMTGAPIPDGADAIVPFEETDEEEQTARWEDGPRPEVRIDVEARPGANVRPAGEDVRAGELVLPAGTILGPAQIGVLASLGLGTARVVRRPRVAILSTGDELLRPGEPRRPGAIYDANGFSLAAMAREMGAEPRVLDIAGDTVEALTARVHEGLADADLLVTSAGVSRGDFDVVKEVLAREGSVGFWTVRMRPGKPLAFGTFDAGEGDARRVVPHLGLPGNPVSAMMTFELFGRPAVYTMLGKPQAWERERVRAVAAERIARPDDRRFYARAIVERRDGRYHARLTGPQGSGVLTSMALANGIVVVPEDGGPIERGRRVRRDADRPRPRRYRRGVTAPSGEPPLERPAEPPVEPSIPPVVRLDAPADSTVSLLTATLVEALRARGYRTASAERRPGGAGLAVTLPSGGRIGVERDVAEADLGAFVATLDPRADLVLAFGYEDPSTPPPTAIVLTSGGTQLATVDAAELTSSLHSMGRSQVVDDLAALLDARVLGGGGEESSGGGLMARVRGWLRGRG